MMLWLTQISLPRFETSRAILKNTRVNFLLIYNNMINRIHRSYDYYKVQIAVEVSLVYRWHHCAKLHFLFRFRISSYCVDSQIRL